MSRRSPRCQPIRMNEVFSMAAIRDHSVATTRGSSGFAIWGRAVPISTSTDKLRWLTAPVLLATIGLATAAAVVSHRYGSLASALVCLRASASPGHVSDRRGKADPRRGQGRRVSHLESVERGRSHPRGESLVRVHAAGRTAIRCPTRQHDSLSIAVKSAGHENRIV